MKNLLFLLMLLLWAVPAVAQTCSPPSTNCGLAEFPCFPYDGILPSQTSTSGAFPGCPTATTENSIWVGFQVNSSGSVTINITPSNCQGVNGLFGIEAGLYADCGFNSPTLALQCSATTSTINFVRTLPSGIYYIAVDGNQGDVCDFSIDVIGDIFVPIIDPVIQAPFASNTTPCPGESVFFSVLPVQSAVSYFWEFPADVVIVSQPPYCEDIEVIWGNQSGSVRVSGFNGCNDQFESEPLFISVPASTTNLVAGYCDDGSSSAGYFYPGTGDILSAGVYDFFFQDVNGCDSIIQIEVTAYSPPPPTLLIFDNLCEDGFVETPYGIFTEAVDTIIVFPGGGPNGFCDEVIQLVVEGNLPAEVDIQKALINCDASPSDTMLLYVDLPDPTIATQWTTSDGQIILRASRTQTLVKGPGTYFIETSLANNSGNASCSRLDSIVLTAEDFLPIDYSVNLVNPKCNGFSNGRIQILSVSGDAPFQYTWSNTDVDRNINNFIGAGTYFLTITADNGCEAKDTFTLTEPPELFAEVASIPVSCRSPQGSAFAQVSGGTPPYQYTWVSGNMTLPYTSDQINDLSAGGYKLIVTDAINCHLEIAFEIERAFGYRVDIQQPSCVNNDGRIAINVGPSAAGFEINWNTGANTAAIDQLGPGAYVVEIIDPQGCVSETQINLTRDPSCTGSISGYVYDNSVSNTCVLGSASVPLPNILVELSDGQQTVTDQKGFYSFTINTVGTYQIELDLTNQTYNVLCDPVRTIIIDKSTDVIADENFYLGIRGSNDLAVEIRKQMATAGQSHTMRIIVFNRGEDLSDYSLSFNYNPALEPGRIVPAPSSQDLVNGNIRWDRTNLRPGFAAIHRVTFSTPTSTPAGTLLEYSAEVDPIAGDATPGDNRSSCTDTLGNTSASTTQQLWVPQAVRADGWSLFPNPVQDQLNIRWSAPEQQVLQMKMLDPLGRQMSTNSVVGIKGQNEYQYPLTSLPTGIYWLVVSDENGEAVLLERVVKVAR